MASNLSLFSPGSGLARPAHRRMQRELDRLDKNGQLEIARINQAADIQAERVAAVGYVGKVALREVAMLSQTEQQLASLVPMATGRLQGIADLAALALADVVAETTRRVK